MSELSEERMRRNARDVRAPCDEVLVCRWFLSSEKLIPQVEAAEQCFFSLDYGFFRDQNVSRAASLSKLSLRYGSFFVLPFTSEAYNALKPNTSVAVEFISFAISR